MSEADNGRLVNAIGDGLAWFGRTGRLRLRFTGSDRAKTLHNLVTNDVKRLSPGQGCEAFVTSPQGKTLGYGVIVVEPEAIWFLTDEPARALLEPHLAKYAALDDTEIGNATEETFELHVAGEGVARWLESIGVAGAERLSHEGVSLGGAQARVVVHDLLGCPGATLLGRVEDRGAIVGALEAARALAGSEAQFEAMRVEAGMPAAGVEVTEKNLPQEVGRDAQAISFVKGCYLGQETVARLDALGHVNRLLKRLVLEIEGPELPTTGAALEAEGKAVGWVTSAARSVRDGRVQAMGYVRTSHQAPGTRLDVVWEHARGVAQVM